MMLAKEPIFDQLPNRPMAHCATLTVLHDGLLLTAWFGGTYETATDQVVLASRRKSQDEGWSTPEIIAERPGYALGQPVFWVRPGGEVWLFFVVIMDPGPPPPSTSFNMLPPIAAWTSAQPYWQRSLDCGQTWESPEPLLDCPGLMYRSRRLVLAERAILPVYDENTWESRMLISDDDGRSWRLTDPINSPPGNIHASLAQLSDGRLLAYLRTGGQGGFIWRTESWDEGETWSTPTPTALPNPNSGIDLLRLESGRLLLAFNNSKTLRTPLNVALAEEDERWDWIQTIEDDPGEFSYPTLAQSDEGQIHMVYTYQREHIQYACFSEAWLRKGKIQ